MLLARHIATPSSYLTIEQSHAFFARRRLAPLEARFELSRDLIFLKSMRSIASHDGFGRLPGDPRRMITICVWSSSSAAERHLASKLSEDLGTDWAAALQVVRARGDHKGVSPLASSDAITCGPLAVLTLGRTAWRTIPRFAAHGAALRTGLRASSELLFATSAGWPTSGNCTFSVWGSQDAMLDFAYRKSDGHAKTAGARPPILTGQLNARMNILASRGFDF